jgi:hypothetical protein
VALFRSFYEEVLVMAREGIPAETLARKICRTIPDQDSRKPFLGHLRDSLNHFEAGGDEAAARTLHEVIEWLEFMSKRSESGGKR